MVVQQLWADMLPAEAGRDRLMNNFSNPPTVTLTVTASHTETREVVVEEKEYEEDVYGYRYENGEQRYVKTGTRKVWRYYQTHTSPWKRQDQGGGKLGYIYTGYGHRLGPIRTESMEVVAWRNSEIFEYAYWEENGNLAEIPDLNGIRLKCKFDVSMDSPTTAALGEMRERMRREGRQHDTTVTVVDRLSVPGWTDDIVISLNESMNSELRKCCSSICGRCFWVLCLLLGYQSAFECFCNAGFDLKRDAMEVYSHKVISRERRLRAQYGKKDEYGRGLVMAAFSAAQRRNEGSDSSECSA
jgi:hypothetical protein